MAGQETDHQGEELMIVELDERLEFGVSVVDSVFQPDLNTSCQNGSSCSSENAGTCVNALACHA